MKTHAADWAPEAPTPAQLKEFFAQCQGPNPRVTQSRMQAFLRGDDKKAEVLVPVPLKHDQTANGWTKLEDVPFDGQPFTPDIVEFLKSGESYVNGEVMKQRAKELNAHLGQGHAEYLLEHQELIPKEWRGKYLLVFPGTVWRDFDGDRRIPSLNGHGDRWCLDFYWLRDDSLSHDRPVCSRG